MSRSSVCAIWPRKRPACSSVQVITAEGFFSGTVPEVDVLRGPYQSALVGQPRQGHELGGVVVKESGLAGLGQSRPDDRVHLVDAPRAGWAPDHLGCGLSSCRLKAPPELALVGIQLGVGLGAHGRVEVVEVVAGEVGEFDLSEGWCDVQAPNGLVVVVGADRPAGFAELQPSLNVLGDGLVGHVGYQSDPGPGDSGFDRCSGLLLGVEGAQPSLAALSLFYGLAIACVPLAVCGVGPLGALALPVGALCVGVPAPAETFDATAHLVSSVFVCGRWVAASVAIMADAVCAGMCSASGALDASLCARRRVVGL
ncbi:hypothetical protein SUDANB67_03033 [Nocardiopsis dassonvillei]